MLEVGYVDVGPANGRAVILLHGWPYDVHSDVQRRKARPAVMEMPGVKLLEVRSPRAGSAAETS